MRKSTLFKLRTEESLISERINVWFVCRFWFLLFQLLFISFWFLCFHFSFILFLISIGFVFFVFVFFVVWVSLFDGISDLVYYVTVYG